MARLPQQTAIFSPSVARAAASAAKDWSFVDSWLHSKFPGHRGVPPFERTPETLRALLALATANETADEERSLVSRLEASALQELQHHATTQTSPITTISSSSPPSSSPTTNTSSDPSSLDIVGAQEAILDAISENLTREGRIALDSLASAAAAASLPPSLLPSGFPPGASDIGLAMITLSTEISDLQQTEARLQALANYVNDETVRVNTLMDDLLKQQRGQGQGQADGGSNSSSIIPSDLAKQNLETQRKIKQMAARLPDLKDRVSQLAASSVSSSSSSSGSHKEMITIEQVHRQEEEYKSLQALKAELDAELKPFRGLSSDIDVARQQLEGMRAELRQVTQRRDAVFEGLVERETPRKPMR
ncbi:hypothetical protein QBC46DRAFT_286824 [Diplogelasinospora grovesii]|uniref:Uncharacterized protein n=1 Tax=Diplogelasinospora grovesii TaxID=303347 RepID=A0AAN6NBF3_9PEZI|nr:hypothetical protein QBC46DRAFT_286824 [Diplogelasinospora grovesii]